jgi:hypothetical protein
MLKHLPMAVAFAEAHRGEVWQTQISPTRPAVSGFEFRVLGFGIEAAVLRSMPRTNHSGTRKIQSKSNPATRYSQLRSNLESRQQAQTLNPKTQNPELAGSARYSNRAGLYSAAPRCLRASGFISARKAST